MLTTSACTVLSSGASSLIWSCKCSGIAVPVYTSLALQGKVSFGINSLNQQGYAKDWLSCSSCALNFNNPPQTLKHNSQECSSCAGRWIKTSWSPPETQYELADVRWKHSQCSAWAGWKIFEAWQVLQRDPSDLSTKLCRFLVEVSGSSSTARLSSLLQTVPARPPPRDRSGASDLMEQWPGVSLTSGCPSHVGRLGGCWSGAWAALGEGGRSGGASSSIGVHGPVLLAERAHLLLTTGAAELCNCWLPGVQGAISPRGEESFCDYFCSHGARFSPHSLKRLFSFFRSFGCYFFFFKIGEFIAQWNNASADWALLYLFLKSRGIAFMPPPQLRQTQLLNSFFSG